MSVFSGPYTTLSPPPTAGPLPVIERANLNTPYSGGGGGGGPIGPNPVVSSITLGGQFPTVNMANGGLFLTNNGFDTTSTIVVIEYNPTAPSGGGIGGPDFTIIQAGTLNTFPVWNLGLGGDGRSELVLNSTMSIVGDSVNISSLVCSTINGVVPGAAVIPADLAVSTLTMGAPGGIVGISTLEGSPGNNGFAIVGTLSVQDLKGVSTINGAAPGGGVGPELGTSSITCSSITMTDGALYGISTINNGTPALLLIAGDVGITGGYLGAGAVSTNTITPLSGTKLTLNAPLVDTTNGDLAVSSVNGAAYPPPGASLQYSTITNPIPNIVPVDPGSTTPILSFSTIAGHVYSASVNARANITVVPASAVDMLQSEILDNNVGNDFLGSWLCSAISTSTASGGFYQQIGGTINWKAGGTGASFAVYSQTSTTIYMDSLKVIDFGAI